MYSSSHFKDWALFQIIDFDSHAIDVILWVHGFQTKHQIDVLHGNLHGCRHNLVFGTAIQLKQ